MIDGFNNKLSLLLVHLPCTVPSPCRGQSKPQSEEKVRWVGSTLPASSGLCRSPEQLKGETSGYESPVLALFPDGGP